MRLMLRVSVSLVLLMALWRSPALGEVTQLAGHSFANGVVPDTVTNDISIDFTGQYTGSQLVIQLQAGSIFQHSPFGGQSAPSEALIGAFPDLAYDSFLTQGGPTSDSSIGNIFWGGGPVNLGGAANSQFDEQGIAISGNPAPGVRIFDQTGFLTARITLSSDARGSWSYLASADRVFGVVESMPIENGRMTVPLEGDYNGSGLVEQGDLDLVLLHWGDPVPPVPDGWVSDLPDFNPDFPMPFIGQHELDGVLLNWSETAQNPWSIVPERVDPDETGGEVTGLEGDFNGSGQVEQADADLLFINYGQPSLPPPEGWVNDFFGGEPIGCCIHLDRIYLNWGNTLSPSSLQVPEPLSVLPWGVALLLVLRRIRSH